MQKRIENLELSDQEFEAIVLALSAAGQNDLIVRFRRAWAIAPRSDFGSLSPR
jgi:hypothetical protein